VSERIGTLAGLSRGRDKHRIARIGRQLRTLVGDLEQQAVGPGEAPETLAASLLCVLASFVGAKRMRRRDHVLTAALDAVAALENEIIRLGHR